MAAFSSPPVKMSISQPYPLPQNSSAATHRSPSSERQPLPPSSPPLQTKPLIRCPLPTPSPVAYACKSRLPTLKPQPSPTCPGLTCTIFFSARISYSYRPSPSPVELEPPASTSRPERPAPMRCPHPAPAPAIYAIKRQLPSVKLQLSCTRLPPTSMPRPATIHYGPLPHSVGLKMTASTSRPKRPPTSIRCPQATPSRVAYASEHQPHSLKLLPSFTCPPPLIYSPKLKPVSHCPSPRHSQRPAPNRCPQPTPARDHQLPSLGPSQTSTTRPRPDDMPKSAQIGNRPSPCLVGMKSCTSRPKPTTLIACPPTTPARAASARKHKPPTLKLQSSPTCPPPISMSKSTPNCYRTLLTPFGLKQSAPMSCAKQPAVSRCPQPPIKRQLPSRGPQPTSTRPPLTHYMPKSAPISNRPSPRPIELDRPPPTRRSERLPAPIRCRQRTPARAVYALQPPPLGPQPSFTRPTTTPVPKSAPSRNHTSQPSFPLPPTTPMPKSAPSRNHPSPPTVRLNQTSPTSRPEQPPAPFQCPTPTPALAAYANKHQPLSLGPQPSTRPPPKYLPKLVAISYCPSPHPVRLKRTAPIIQPNQSAQFQCPQPKPAPVTYAMKHQLPSREHPQLSSTRLPMNIMSKSAPNWSRPSPRSVGLKRKAPISRPGRLPATIQCPQPTPAWIVYASKHQPPSLGPQPSSPALPPTSTPKSARIRYHPSLPPPRWNSDGGMISLGYIVHVRIVSVLPIQHTRFNFTLPPSRKILSLQTSPARCRETASLAKCTLEEGPTQRWWWSWKKLARQRFCALCGGLEHWLIKSHSPQISLDDLNVYGKWSDF